MLAIKDNIKIEVGYCNIPLRRPTKSITYRYAQIQVVNNDEISIRYKAKTEVNSEYDPISTNSADEFSGTGYIYSGAGNGKSFG